MPKELPLAHASASRWLTSRPAGSLEARLSARSYLGLPKASASLGKLLGRAGPARLALIIYIGPGDDCGRGLLGLLGLLSKSWSGSKRCGSRQREQSAPSRDRRRNPQRVCLVAGRREKHTQHHEAAPPHDELTRRVGMS